MIFAATIEIKVLFKKHDQRLQLNRISEKRAKLELKEQMSEKLQKDENIS